MIDQKMCAKYRKPPENTTILESSNIMNIALVIAGGNGSRTGQDVPKQFLTIHDKPIIIYTLEVLQNCKKIDKIIVSCIDGWQEFVSVYAKQFMISKLEHIVTAGAERFYSIDNGIQYCKSFAEPSDILLIFDANRPMITEDAINTICEKASQAGCALSILPCVDSMFCSSDGEWVEKNLERKFLFRGVTPDAFKFAVLIDICEQAKIRNLTDKAIWAIAVELGVPVVMNEVPSFFFKITTADDIELFKAVVESKPLIYLKGK